MTEFDPSEAARAIRDKAAALDFDAVGIARTADMDAAGERLHEFLALNRHGDMAWMESRAAQRDHPRHLWAEARSAIMLGVSYAPGDDPMAQLERTDRGAISVYARSKDYHDVVKKRLKRLGRWLSESYDCALKVFVDTAPVMEKPLAEKAGIGWQGKHTNLVSRGHGSWLFLGAILTTLELPPDAPHQDRCGTCRQCLDICPTDAFPAPYQLDARRCISYLTIEHKGHIAREFRRPMGNRIYGCDDCLAVCPWNKFARESRHAQLQPRPELTLPRLVELSALDDAAFRALTAGTAIKRTGRDRFVRNVLIALGNSGDRDALPAIEARLDDPSPLVRAMAVWALGEIAPDEDSRRLRNRYLDNEKDDQVRAEWAALAAD